MAPRGDPIPTPNTAVGVWIWNDTTSAWEPMQKDWLGGALSSPPHGYYKVTNLYVDPDTGKLIVVYDDTPTP